ATLAIGNDFRYYKHKLGLNLYPEVKSCKLKTNFVYQQQGQIVVPRFRFAPEFNSRDEFTRELIDYLTKTLDYDEGYGTLVLFFNRNQLQEVYATLPKVLHKRILLQTNYMSNQRLISEHKQKVDGGKPSIIFGLNSFAEGVDLPSIYCMHVIITKLPFETHKDPQNMVQEYWVKFEKGSYFAEVSLPEASIRLVQAAGRLIRDEEDYGQVTICDNRLVTKNYGALLLDALPEFNRKYNNAFIQAAFAKIAPK
ncbi:MAG: helicase C-terminal domain-containing protein, partial [Burkholderiales bacterium]